MTTPSEYLWQRWRDEHDASARAELLSQHLGLVHHVVRQIAARVGDAVAYDDLIGAGTLGRPATPDEVATALQIDVPTYWRWHADGETTTMIPIDAPVPSSERGNVTLGEMIPDADGPAPDAPLEEEESKRVLREAIAGLPEQQRTVLTLCYFEELTLRQIAEVLHVTESRISQVRTAALKRLRDLLTADGFAL